MKYIEPEIKITTFSVENVVTTSVNLNSIYDKAGVDGVTAVKSVNAADIWNIAK